MESPRRFVDERSGGIGRKGPKKVHISHERTASRLLRGKNVIHVYKVGRQLLGKKKLGYMSLSLHTEKRKDEEVQAQHYDSP